MDGDEGVFLIGERPGAPQRRLVERPDHARGEPHLHPSTQPVVTAHQCLRIGEGRVRRFDEGRGDVELRARGDEAATDAPADARRLEGVDDRLRQVRPGMRIHEIDQRGDAGTDALDAAMQRGGGHVLLREFDGRRAGHAGEPVAQHTVVAQTLEQRLEEMRMRVHHAGDDDLSPAVDDLGHRVGRAKLSAAADGRDAVALDQDAGLIQHIPSQVHRNDPAVRQNDAHRGRSPQNFGMLACSRMEVVRIGAVGMTVEVTPAAFRFAAVSSQMEGSSQRMPFSAVSGLFM